MSEEILVTQPKNVPVLLTPEERQKHGVGEIAYMLSDPWFYSWRGRDGVYRRFNVPVGFIYDGASVPQIVWTVSGIIPDGLIRAAALVHDYLYVYRGAVPRGTYQKLIDGNWVDLEWVWTRREADKMFCRIMRESGVPRSKRRMAYRAVRLFGGGFWST